MDNKTSRSAGSYPADIEIKLGFDKIRELIAAGCQTESAAGGDLFLRFDTDRNRIHKSIRLIEEVSGLRGSGRYFSFPEDTVETDRLISVTDMEGAFLREDDFAHILKTLRHLDHNILVCLGTEGACPGLDELKGELDRLIKPIELIDGILDAEGHVKPNASALLWEINKKINQKEKDVRRILHGKFEEARKNGWAGDTEITIRNERLVIPLIAEFKRKMPGFVHDDSQSGKFLYIEPIECFEENNALRELQLEKKKEIEQILRDCTRALAAYKFQIRKHLRFCIQLDVLNSKSIFSTGIRAAEPMPVQEHDDCELLEARHPLLYLHLSKNNKSPVPLRFHFKKGNFLVIISGPNAGGKSIALKTIGLLQYMYQCGLPVPASPDTKISLYKRILIDIGDNQSLENNLSSYSSHLLNMKYFMEHADGDTLYLIDELGNGTDPAIGSTIAQAILERLLKKNAMGIVTTHFGSLKNWAANTDGVQNARMLYDLKNLEPLFELEPDKAGSSFAIEVASKVGIDNSILQRARNISRHRKEMDLDELLAENEKQKKELEDSRKRMEDREKTLEKLIADYESLKQSLSENRQTILQEARSKAGHLIEQANKKIENTIREIRESEAEKEKTKVLRKELTALKSELTPLKHDKQAPGNAKPLKKQPGKPAKPLATGSVVRHEQHKVSGEILEIKKDKAQVLFGVVKIWLPLDELYASEPDKKHIPKTATFNVDHFNKQTSFRAEIDLRGIRGEEAIEKLDNWLHDAHLLGMHSLRIIHGRGYGILRKLILEHLKSLAFVESYEHESEQLGGDGVTLLRIS